MKFQFDDANCGDARKSERLDCTVRASSIALGVSYQEAHDRLERLGRKPKRRVDWAKVAPALGFESLPEFSCMRLSRVMAALPETGRFIVRVPRHVFAVVDGVIHDTQENSASKIVRMVYQEVAA
jgi:hypothetical protein